MRNQGKNLILGQKISKEKKKKLLNKIIFSIFLNGSMKKQILKLDLKNFLIKEVIGNQENYKTLGNVKIFIENYEIYNVLKIYFIIKIYKKNL